MTEENDYQHALAHQQELEQQEYEELLKIDDKAYSKWSNQIINSGLKTTQQPTTTYMEKTV